MKIASTLHRIADVLRGSDLLEEEWAPGDIDVPGEVSITGVSQDSRTVRPGDLFLAWKGTVADGHDHLPAALAAGASAAVVERFIEGAAIPQLRVRQGRRAAAIVAHELMERPTDRLRVTAVTGTNGKTTVAYLLRHLLARLGPTSTLGTLGLVGPDGGLRPGTGGLTTPGPVELAETLSGLVEEGIDRIVLEASSHALEQHRLDALAVDTACFTNLSREHLDYHGTLDRYFQAKTRLLELLRDASSGVVVNGNDPVWERLPDIPGRLLVTRLVATESDRSGPDALEVLPELRIADVELSGEGSRFHAGWGEQGAAVELPLLGDFNVENAAVALGAALLEGLPLEAAAAALADAPPVPGRLEVTVRDPVPVILDYAHTPDALRRVLATLAPLYPGRLIVVFGAGGDRDRTKRPEMGRIAAEGANVAVVTSDNPRTEDPDTIVDEIVAGMGGAPHHRVTDRRRAIARALELAHPGDAVLLAGKGHEDYQVVGTETRPFDERIVVREILGLAS